MYTNLRLIIVAWTLLSAAGRAAAQSYTITDLGSLGGTSTATSINDSGQVVGYSDTSVPGDTHAFLWSVTTGIQDLGMTGGNSTQAFGINSKGQIVGGSNTVPNATEDPFLRTQTGGFDIFGLNGSANAINDLSQVTGTAGNNQHAFLWTSSTGIQDLGTLGGSTSWGAAINSHAHIVGFSFITGDACYHAFLWTKSGGMADIGTLGGANSYALGVNDTGHIVGWAHVAGSTAYHAFHWTKSHGMQDLGTLGGTNSLASGINKAGQIVGTTDTTGAFVWTKAAGLQDLNSLIDANSGWRLGWASAINNVGQIVGNGMINGQIHAVLLTPIR
jgi:probable HAF family extracellular repeat protein